MNGTIHLSEIEQRPLQGNASTYMYWSQNPTLPTKSTVIDKGGVLRFYFQAEMAALSDF